MREVIEDKIINEFRQYLEQLHKGYQPNIGCTLTKIMYLNIMDDIDNNMYLFGKIKNL